MSNNESYTPNDRIQMSRDEHLIVNMAIRLLQDLDHVICSGGFEVVNGRLQPR